MRPTPAAPTRGHKKRARTRQQLMRAAVEVIAERGEGFAITDVVERAGVSNGTFYNYFDDRADLVDQLVGDLVAELTDDSAARPVADDPARRFATISAQVLCWAATSPRVAEAILRLEIFHRPELDEAMFGHLRDDLRDGVAAGVFSGPADQATVDVIAGALLMAARRLVATGPDPEYQQAALTRLLQSLGLPLDDARTIADAGLTAVLGGAG